MDVATDAGLATASEPTPIAITPPGDTLERLSATDAARLLRSLRWPKERYPDQVRGPAPERGAAPPVEQQESTAPPDMIRGSVRRLR